MRPVISSIRIGVPGLTSRVIDLLVVAGALVGVPIAVWVNAPILVWVWLGILLRVAPPWLDWTAAFLMSAHLATLAGWSWGVALFLTSTTVAVRHWVERQPGNWRWASEVALGVIWLGIAHFGQTQIDLRLSFLLWFIGILGLLFFREREGM